MKKLVLSLLGLLCTAQFSIAQNWSLTGNSGTTPGTNYIGTQDPKDMVFKTSSTEWMRLTKDGLFGIGLVTPKAKIDMLIPTTYLTTQESGIRITYPSVATTEPIINTSIFEVRSTILGSYSSKFIVKDNGNVGIGMLVPDARFHVKDYNGVKLDAHIEGFTLLDGYEASLLLGRQTGAAYGEWGIEYNNHVSGLNFWRPAGSTAPHGPNSGNYHLFIKNDGRVSIGIDATVASNYPAGYRLYVAEGILTEKVKVALINTSDWADYVFKKGYNLLPINEVETYISENGHLPGVPSAQEVKETGIDVAKMDAKLLEKIEELTLYMIQLKKENEEIKAELELLKK